MLRRFLLVVLIFLIAVVVAADRVGALAAAHVLASKVESDEHLPNRPDVSIDGIPFLTQAFGGDYKDVSITAHDVPVAQVPVTTLHVNLHHAHLPFGRVIRGSVSTVPIDRITGSAFISFTDANDYLARHSPVASLVQLQPSGTAGSATVLDRITVGGRRLTLRGEGTVSVSNNVVRVGVSKLSGAVASGGHVASSVINLALRQLNLAFPLQSIPFQLQLTSVQITPTGITGTGVATNVVLGKH
jgi:hypothetical protein